MPGKSTFYLYLLMAAANWRRLSEPAKLSLNASLAHDSNDSVYTGMNFLLNS